MGLMNSGITTNRHIDKKFMFYDIKKSKNQIKVYSIYLYENCVVHFYIRHLQRVA